MARVTLNDYFSNLPLVGIFTGLKAPWNGVVDDDTLNLWYHGQHSGKKRPAPILDEGYISENGHITSTGLENLQHSLEGLYGKRWEGIWTAFLKLTSFPLDTVNVTETVDGTGNDTTSGSDSTSISKDDTRTYTPSVKETLTHTGTEKNEVLSGTIVTEHLGTVKPTGKEARVNTRTGSIIDGGVDVTYGFGFNSQDSDTGGTRTAKVGHDNTRNFETLKDDMSTTYTDRVDTTEYKDTTTDTEQRQRTPNLTDTTSYTGSNTTHDTGTDSNTVNYGKVLDHTENMTRTIIGYSGVLTSDAYSTFVDVLSSGDFFSMVFQDVDQLLTIGVY